MNSIWPCLLSKCAPTAYLDVCVFERSGDLPANLDLILCIECIVFCHIYTSISADGSISAVSHTKADWAAWSAVALIPRPVDGGLCLGETQGNCWKSCCDCVAQKAFSSGMWPTFSVRCLSLCVNAVNRHAYRSNTLGLKAVILHICDIIVFASQPSKIKQI